MNREKLDKILEELPFTLTDEQSDFIEKFICGKGHFSLLGDAGCVDADTEFLTKKGWVPISDYSGEDIAVWREGGKTTFEKPEDYVKVPTKNLNRLKTTTMDMVISDEHRVPHITSKGFFRVSRAEDLLKYKVIKVPRGFSLEGVGVAMSEELLRVLVMQSADGSVVERLSGIRFRLNLKRPEKIRRAHKLLTEANIEYTHGYSENTGYTRFYYKPPQEISFKGLQSLWDMSELQASIIFEEALEWDGCHGKGGRKSFTGNKVDCEIFQLAASTATGNYCNMTQDTREKYKSDIFDVRVSRRSNSIIELNIEDKPDPKSVVITKDGMKYCFTTSTSFWLARKNGKIFPTGNSGKSAIMSILKKYYEDELIGCGTTGVAAVNLPDEMGIGTAHSVFNMPITVAIESDWKKRAHDILTKTDLIKVIVIDEAFNHSSQELAFYLDRVRKANKRTSKREKRDIRLLLVGDVMQNSPIISQEQKIAYRDLYGSELMFESTLWEENNIQPFIFQEVKRQSGNEPKDIWFRKALQVIRFGYKEHYEKVCEGLNKKWVGGNHGKDAVYIAPTNSMVNVYNDKYLARNNNLKMTFEVEFDKKYNKKLFPMDWEVTLAEGCRVICLVNNPDNGTQNGTVLTITSVSIDGVFGVKDNGVEVFVPIHEFKEDEVYASDEVKDGELVQVQKRRHVASAYMLPVKLCAAFSCNRVQGRTFDFETVVDFGSDRQAWLYNKEGMEDFMTGGAFVALSRVTNIDHLKLKHKIYPHHIKVCERSRSFWFKCLKGQKGV